MKPIEIVSWEFLVLIVVTAAIYYILAPRVQIIWLLAVSYFFCATWNLGYVGVLLGFTITNFFLAKRIEKTRSRTLFFTGLVINAGSLVILKILAGPYAPRVLEQIGSGTITGVLLPLGFSFYTLQLISYIIDVYRGQIKAETDFLSFALYLAYFPKLLAGPIERTKSFLPQLKQERVVDRVAIEQGLYLILLGLLRKVIIADQLAGLHPSDIFSKPENYTSLERAIWLLVFAFILYNDFAGYTSIVRGISSFLGIRLSPNFRQPFFARTFSDFWGRWHISLSEWLRDYIFFPLRRTLVQLQTSRWMATVLPPMITMLVSGFWHGASLAFLFWGFLHGSYLVFEQFLLQFNMLPKDGFKAKLYSIFVFVMVTLAWIPFNTPSVRAALRYISGPISPLMAFNLFILPELLLIFLSVWLDWQEQRHGDLAFPRKWTVSQQAWGAAVAVVLLWLFTTTGNDLSRFVYQFF